MPKQNTSAQTELSKVAMKAALDYKMESQALNQAYLLRIQTRGFNRLESDLTAP